MLAGAAWVSIAGLERQARMVECTAVEQAPPRAAVRRATLLFAGDWMQHTPQLTAARHARGYDYTRSIEMVAPMMREADLMVVNLETTLKVQPPYTGYPLFRSPAALADALRSCGVDVALLANNHICDGGRTGLRTTCVELSKRGIAHTGAFSSSEDRAHNCILHLTVEGIRLALVNYTYGTNGLPTPQGQWVNRIDTLAIAADLALIDRRKTDCIIACLHWGNEYERQPNAEQRALADFLQRQGVALIVGSHPHVIQPIEADSSRVVAWSLGNFVSNQQQRYRDGGLLLKVEIECHDSIGCRFRTEALPVWVERKDFRILPARVADTLPMAPASRERYREFIRDTRALLSSSVDK